MPINKFIEQLEHTHSLLFKLFINENYDFELFGISMTLFHYYTYFKSFKHFDRHKLIISCLFLSGKIKGVFIKPDILKSLYKKYSPKSNDLTDKEITSFELDLLIYLGFEVDIETPYYYLDRIIRKTNFSKIIFPFTKNTESTTLFTPPNNDSSNNDIDKKECNSLNLHNLNNQSDNNSCRITKVIDSNNKNQTFGHKRPEEYFHSLSVEEYADKIKVISFNVLNDMYRRAFCIVFRPRCIALVAFVIAFNLLVDAGNSDHHLDFKYFYETYYSEGDYKDFLLCYNEVLKIFQ